MIAKRVKKVSKRAAYDDDDETQTPKQDVYIVTPSRNHEEYLAEIRSTNENAYLPTSSEAPVTPETVLKESSTEEPMVPTLSNNPFLPPSAYFVTVPENSADETTQSAKSYNEPEASTSAETTQATVVESSAVHFSSEPVRYEENTPSTTEQSTTHETSTATVTTTKKTHYEESEESNESSEEEGKTVRFTLQS